MANKKRSKDQIARILKRWEKLEARGINANQAAPQLGITPSYLYSLIKESKTDSPKRKYTKRASPENPMTFTFKPQNDKVFIAYGNAEDVRASLENLAKLGGGQWA